MRQFRVFCSVVKSSLSACQFDWKAPREQEWQPREEESKRERELVNLLNWQVGSANESWKWIPAKHLWIKFKLRTVFQISWFCGKRCRKIYVEYNLLLFLYFLKFFFLCSSNSFSLYFPFFSIICQVSVSLCGSYFSLFKLRLSTTPRTLFITVSFIPFLFLPY